MLYNEKQLKKKLNENVEFEKKKIQVQDSFFRTNKKKKLSG